MNGEGSDRLDGSIFWNEVMEVGMVLFSFLAIL